MIRLVTLLNKAGKAGLIPIQKQVTKKGKTFTQTFYVKPDDVTPASKPATNDQWLGPLGDERVYIRAGAVNAVRIPEEMIAKRFTWNGINFVIHRSYDSENRFTSKDHWTVTEVSTGVRASAHETVEGAESLALQALESRGPEEMMNMLKRFMPISATDSLDFIENPTIANDKPAPDDKYYDLAEQVFVSVMGEDLDPEDEYQQDRLADIRQWLKRRYTTSEEVDSVMDDIGSDDWHALDLAIEFDIVIDDARELSQDLSDISNLSDKDMDAVLDWYRSNYSEGDMIPERVNNLGASSEYGNDLDAEWVANYALENDVTLEWAQEAAQEVVEEMDSEMRDHLEDVTDSYGNDWDTSELEPMVSWMGGGTKYYREEGRLLDEQLRAGNVEEAQRIMNRDIMLSVFTERVFDIPLDSVYRGTPNAIWATVNPGDRFPHSFSSFSKSREFALGFHSANHTTDDGKSVEHEYDKFLIVMEKPDGGYIQGIDIHDIGENLRENGTPNSTFENYENEREVLVRAPSIEVTRTEDVISNGRSIHLVYVKPVEMELLELMKSKFTSTADLIWSSFNEPLAEPHTPLSKAKEGLIPVKKQVTKKGKTFSQTFYVKPESVPNEPSKPMEVDVLGSVGTQPKAHYNKPDGFYIQFNLGGGESKAYRVPEKHIYGTHTYAGFNLVVHRVLSPAPDLTFQAGYRVSELSTGMGLGVKYQEDPEEAIRLAEEKIDKLTPEAVAKTVNSARKISHYTLDENVIRDTEDFPAVEPNRPTTEEDYTKSAIRIFNNSGMDEYTESEGIILTIEDIEEWLKSKDVDASTTDELIEIEKVAREPNIIRAAVYEGLTYEEAEERQGYIDHITNLIYESTKFSDAIDAFGPEDVESWGRRRSDNLLSDPLIYDISVGSDLDPDIEWNAADIMAYAVINDMTVAQVQEVALDDIKASEDELDSQGLVDVGGGSWKMTELQALGSWVTGRVEQNRTDAKAMFYRREVGGDESAYEPLVDAIESHLTSVEGVLYRGTKNKDWLDANVGDIVPVGIASFSDSEHNAVEFSLQNPNGGPCVLVLDPDDSNESDLPVGVRVTDIVDAGRESGIGPTMTRLGVDKYYFERETIVMSPAVEILAVDRDSGKVRVRPAKMNLVRFIKSSSDSDFIARLEKTFDEPLHRDATLDSGEDSGELL